MKLTVTVITKNEAAHISAALESVAWADEILVVDSGSTDETVALARRYTPRVEVREWPGYSAQKNYAADAASHDWILALDADERVTPALAAEIRTLLASAPSAPGYRIPRLTWYLGRWIRGTDWYPDYQLRLYDRRAGRWNGRRVHESVDLRGSPGVLTNPLQHYAYRDISHHLTTIDRYTTLAAEQWLAEGRRTNAFEAAIHPPIAFLRNYLLRGGIRDGAAGLLVSALNSYYVFLKFAKLWELQHADRSPLAARRSPKSAESPPENGQRPAASGQRTASGQPFDSPDRPLAQDRRSADSARSAASGQRPADG